jgi:hypothetical protein
MKIFFMMIIFISLSLFLHTNLLAQNVVVQGIVTNNAGQPVPGLMLSIFHPAYGRSRSVLTDERGYYIFYNIIVVQGPSYIEAYWGSNLIYRSEIHINGPMFWNIHLR